MSLRVCLIILCSCAFQLDIGSSADVDAEKTRVWGPGLNENANLAVRYFYIQAKDKDGNE